MEHINDKLKTVGTPPQHCITIYIYMRIWPGIIWIQGGIPTSIDGIIRLINLYNIFVICYYFAAKQANIVIRTMYKNNTCICTRKRYLMF